MLPMLYSQQEGSDHLIARCNFQAVGAQRLQATSGAVRITKLSEPDSPRSYEAVTP